jgi:hypothetical protein
VEDFPELALRKNYFESLIIIIFYYFSDLLDASTEIFNDFMLALLFVSEISIGRCYF